MSSTEVYSFEHFSFGHDAASKMTQTTRSSLAQTSILPPQITPHFQPQDVPRSPRRQIKHTKGLSLSFPIVLSTNDRIVCEPSPVNSSVGTPLDSGRNSPRSKAMSISVPPSLDPAQAASTAKTSGDFLTLLAVQERKVLELKEELQKAETDLLQLKRQWAVFEAKKKRQEVKNVRKSQSSIASAHSRADSRDTIEEEREEEKKRRILIERSHNINGDGTAATKSPGRVSRKGTQRVFEGRHARTLSLLSPQMLSSIQSNQSLAAENMTPSKENVDFIKLAEETPRPGLSRMPTLEGILSQDLMNLGFGKTYKDLAAAHRRSLPPVAADMLVRQGKQVVDGVREGLWTFFEDIRQATVGEEGINGTNNATKSATRSGHPPSQSSKHKQHHSGSKKNPVSKDSHGKRTRRVSDKARKDDASFWKEFGLETTPHKQTINTADISELPATAVGHKQRNHTSSTDSTTPPDLLTDNGADENDEEEEWDEWESPVLPTTKNPKEATSTKTRDADANLIDARTIGLAWSEIPMLMPQKVNRDTTGLMQEWAG